ncbi:DNA/RNA non-specific endonuclease [Microcoleus sp.]|uniref:DNA/RNA non-specific endonuclease n=1 Tax=Microcoleus sp. TaxID=44472 RepID=UPI0035247F6B
MKEVNLFVSTFDKGKGLLPWDKVVNLSDSALLPGFSETQKRQLLSKPWNGYDDFNPNRILTATWKKDTGKWYGHDGITPLNQPLNDPANTSTNFTLPRSLTAGQNYNFAVEAVSNSGAVTKDFGQFKTLPPVSNSPFSIDTLKDYIPNQRNYALKLEAGSSIIHNRFVVPDWGSLRLDLHAPGVTNNFKANPKGTLDVTIRPLDPSIPEFSQTITLQKAQNATDSNGAPSTYLEDKYKVDYGRTGFESFYIDVPERLRGQVATVEFKGQASIPVYLDNVFFQSDSLKFGNPNRARTYLDNTDPNNTYQTNYLIEKPQYTLSYNGQTNTPNWVGWVLDKGWAEGNAGRAAENFAEDSELPASSFYMVQHDDYDFKSQIGYDKNDEYGRFLWNKKAFFWPDRGHLAPSADRQRSKKDNIATFLTTNIIPQDSKQNSGIWAAQEKGLRALAKNRDFKFFIFAGGSGEGGGTVTYGPLPTEVKGPKPIQIGDSNPNQFANFTAGTDSNNPAKIKVPDALWKVVLGFSPENKSEVPDIHFAWWIPNNSYSIKETLDYTKPTQYSDGLIGPTFENRAWNDGAFTMSIKALEARLNKDLPLDSQYDFLSNIHDPAVKDNLRSVQRLLPQ